MESLTVYPKTQSQLKVLKNLLKEMQISFEKTKLKNSSKELPVSKNTPNAETIKAIEEAHRERKNLKSFSDVKSLMESLENE